jgi:SET domain-containing protein
MERQNLLKNLQKDVYARIECSKIHGVGVVAIKDIPKGTNPYKRSSTAHKDVGISDKYIEKLKPEVKKMVHDFFQKEDDGKWYLPQAGLNSIDVSFYMNHSDKPNIKVTDAKERFVTFRAAHNIKKGDELTINYNS